MVYDFGCRLRELRKRKLSQTKAAALGISRIAISSHESNIGYPSVDMYYRKLAIYIIQIRIHLGIDNRKTYWMDLTSDEKTIEDIMLIFNVKIKE